MVAKGDPLRAWRDEVGRRMLNLDFAPCGEGPFHAQFTPLLFSEHVRVAAYEHSAGLTFRDDEIVRDGGDDVALLFGRACSLDIQHQGRETRLPASAATMVHTSVPGSVGSSRPHRYVGILVPRDALDLPQSALAPLFGSRWSHRSSALNLLKSYVQCLGKNGCSAPAVAAASSLHIVELLRLAVEEESGRETGICEDTIGSARLKLVLAAIDEAFRDPELSEPWLALRVGLSTRSLQRLFEEAGIRFSESVNELRLSEAYTQLTDSTYADRTVADIAYGCGFSDLSHFNRLFRRRYDATPTAVRRSKQT